MTPEKEFLLDKGMSSDHPEFKMIERWLKEYGKKAASKRLQEYVESRKGS